MFNRNIFNQSLVIMLCLVWPAGRAWAENPSRNLERYHIVLQDSDAKRSISAVRTETPIKVDGILDDPAWQKARFQSQFTQREPEEGKPASEKTEIGFLFDKKYFLDTYHDHLRGLVCRNRHPLENDSNTNFTTDSRSIYRVFLFIILKNGKKLPDNIHERIKKMCEAAIDKTVEKDFKVVLQLNEKR